MIKLKELLEKKRYSAVLLDERSRNLLIETYKSQIPSGWEIIAHHMTIDPFGLVTNVGDQVVLETIELGKSDKAMAVKVVGYKEKTNNKFPHITIAIDRTGGGKPKDSNDIVSWIPVKDKIELNGVVENL